MMYDIDYVDYDNTGMMIGCVVVWLFHSSQEQHMSAQSFAGRKEVKKKCFKVRKWWEIYWQKSKMTSLENRRIHVFKRESQK